VVMWCTAPPQLPPLGGVSPHLPDRGGGGALRRCS
jgi:hypothetical protein